MPLPRLPTHHGRRLCCCRATAGRDLSIDERQTDLPFHTEPLRGKHKRGFCANCGSRITGAEKQDESSQFIGILAGSLDDPSWFRRQMDIFTSEAQPWNQMDPAIPKYEKYPPMA
jgi:hypothetical protein